MRQCKSSWLDSYLLYTQNQESPIAFSEWIGLVLLAASTGRHIWLPRVGYTLYPNLFIILIAGSAICRKSVAVNIGLDILKSLEKPPMVFAQKITAEALIQALESAKVDGASAGLVCATELSTFLGTEGVKSGIIPALTDLYDNPKEWVYHTRGRGKEILRNVTVSILAASTKEWLRSAIPTEAIGGGFTSRILFVYQEQPSKLMLFPENGISVEELKPMLIHDLNLIRNKIKGPMELTNDAKKIARQWYEDEWGKIRDPKLDGYFARKHDTMFKVAMLLSISESSNRQIDHTHIQRALELLKENEQNLGEIIASVAATVIGGETEKVYEMIKKAGKIKHTDLLRKSWRLTGGAKELNEMIKTLVESGEIKQTLADNNRTRIYEIKRRR